MSDKRIKERKLWFLVVISLIILLILWLTFLKIFPKKKIEEDNLIKDLINQSFLLRENFNKFLRGLKISNYPRIKSNESRIINQEIEKLKEKILEYLNKE